jgi:hypothetical protein
MQSQGWNGFDRVMSSIFVDVACLKKITAGHQSGRRAIPPAISVAVPDLPGLRHDIDKGD